ncbi:MAG: hypothetical protein JO250_02775, partial [Armatimonadetes bacterium]|nr:hypothetical protein [Armatimonadota bacterium]
MKSVPLLSLLFVLAVAGSVSAQQAAAPAERDLVLSRWEGARWALYPGMTVRNNVGRTPAGEPLTRLTLAPGGSEQDALTQVNLPATASDHSLHCFFRKSG